jgi:glucose/arabinose dehydrogenase
MLYAAFGDGGGGSPDQDHNGQNFNAYLAGMIRIDVDHGDPYMIPSDNPFVGVPNRLPELWAKGFRNPWRYAFDPATSQLYIADVGEALHEEVDVVGAAQGGLNFGWSIMEGLSCFNATGCDQTGLTLPVLDYGHVNRACSVTGGYVYRGSAMPSVQGHYFYSDFCAGWLHSFRYQGGAALDQRDWGITLTSVKSFGQDFAGELYIVSSNSVYKLVPGP